MIDDCYFSNISVISAIINNKASQVSTISIISAQFGITSGAIYISQHRYQGTINIYNVSITSNHLDIRNNTFPLFYFSSSDAAYINQVYILYLYDIGKSCHYDGNISNAILNEVYDVYLCKNPIIAVQNLGLVCLYPFITDWYYTVFHTNRYQWI